MPPVLLDTDVLSELIKRRNATVQQHALAYSRQHGRLAFSAITRYEVVRGYVQRGATIQLARFNAFCQQSLIFPITDTVLDRAADLWAFARNQGHPHNDADLIIAATALENGRSLVTGNTAHFAWPAVFLSWFSMNWSFELGGLAG
jgi:tRNA(fMet)-specific endonuclease VapC